MIGNHEQNAAILEAVPPALENVVVREPTTHPDLGLVRRILAGDRAAFDDFSQRLVPALYRFAASRLASDRELTRDIVQTTVCKALARLETYRGSASLLTWLCACCRNEIAMHFRRLGSRPRETPLAEEPHRIVPAEFVVAPRSESMLLDRESAAWVHTALDRLPSDHSRVLEWKYIEGISVNEIAERLGKSPKAAESVLTRARAAFRDTYRQLMEELGQPLAPGDRQEPVVRMSRR